MALVLADRVQETTTTAGTGTLTLGGAVNGFQTFAIIGNSNTCYYTIVDGSAWEVGIGTYSTTGPSLARTTVLSNSNGNTTPITLSAASKPVFVTYPAEKSVNVDDGSTVVLSGGLKINGTLETNSNPYVGGSYGGNQFYPTNGGGAQVNSLYDGVATVNVGTVGTIAKTFTFDINGNFRANNVFTGFTSTTTTGGTTTLTVASAAYQRFTGTLTQVVQLPDATTLSTGFVFTLDCDSTVAITVVNAASGALDTIYPGGVANFVVISNATVAGTWVAHGLVPSDVDWGTNTLRLSTTVVTGGTWQGGTIAGGFGGTGLTSFSAANNALYSTGTTTLTAGTLPILAGGTGTTTGTSPYATNIAGGGAYQVVYQTSAGVTAFVTNGTTGQVLTANTGAAPTFQTSTAASKSYAQAMRIMGI
jgi:hypothetical protein